jgi:hypothetical protein
MADTPHELWCDRIKLRTKAAMRMQLRIEKQQLRPEKRSIASKLSSQNPSLALGKQVVSKTLLHHS